MQVSNRNLWECGCGCRFVRVDETVCSRMLCGEYTRVSFGPFREHSMNRNAIMWKRCELIYLMDKGKPSQTRLDHTALSQNQKISFRTTSVEQSRAGMMVGFFASFIVMDSEKRKASLGTPGRRYHHHIVHVVVATLIRVASRRVVSFG
eukprot:jgi/Psemu1/306301/fgenesh1_kg.247_\